MSKTFKLKLTSAVVVAGTATPAGSLVDVEEALARRLLDNGKALLATQDDVDLAEVVETATDASDEGATAAVKPNRAKPKANTDAQTDGEPK